MLSSTCEKDMTILEQVTPTRVRIRFRVRLRVQVRNLSRVVTDAGWVSSVTTRTAFFRQGLRLQLFEALTLAIALTKTLALTTTCITLVQL